MTAIQKHTEMVGYHRWVVVSREARTTVEALRDARHAIEAEWGRTVRLTDFRYDRLFQGYYVRVDGYEVTAP